MLPPPRISDELEFTSEVVFVAAVDVVPLVVMEMKQVNTVFFTLVVVRHLYVPSVSVRIQQPLGLVERDVDPSPYPLVLLGNVVAASPHMVARQHCQIHKRTGFVYMYTVYLE